MMSEGYPVKVYNNPVKRYCQILEIADNPELIALYKECHSKDKHWKEIREGIRSVGILEMEMYISSNKVFMIVETELDFNWEDSMNRLASMPRQAEWEEFVAKLQGCEPQATSAQKWTRMERMFHLYDD